MATNVCFVQGFLLKDYSIIMKLTSNHLKFGGIRGSFGGTYSALENSICCS